MPIISFGNIEDTLKFLGGKKIQNAKSKSLILELSHEIFSTSVNRLTLIKALKANQDKIKAVQLTYSENEAHSKHDFFDTINLLRDKLKNDNIYVDIKHFNLKLERVLTYTDEPYLNILSGRTTEVIGKLEEKRATKFEDEDRVISKKLALAFVTDLEKSDATTALFSEKETEYFKGNKVIDKYAEDFFSFFEKIAINTYYLKNDGSPETILNFFKSRKERSNNFMFALCELTTGEKELRITLSGNKLESDNEAHKLMLACFKLASIALRHKLRVILKVKFHTQPVPESYHPFMLEAVDLLAASDAQRHNPEHKEHQKKCAEKVMLLNLINRVISTTETYRTITAHNYHFDPEEGTKEGKKNPHQKEQPSLKVTASLVAYKRDLCNQCRRNKSVELSLFASINTSSGLEMLCRKAIELDPEAAQAYIKLAFLLQNKGDWHSIIEAESLYRKVITLDPSFALAYNNLGCLLKNKGDWRSLNEAESLYRNAITLDPSFALAYSNLGNIILQKNGGQDPLYAAESQYRKAINLDPNYFPPYMKLAMLLVEKGYKNSLEEAETLFRWIIANNRSDAKAHCRLADILYQRRDSASLREAEVLYGKVIQLDPNNTHAQKRHFILVQKNKYGSPVPPQSETPDGEAFDKDPQDAMAPNDLSVLLADQSELQTNKASKNPFHLFAPRSETTFSERGGRSSLTNSTHTVLSHESLLTVAS